MSVKIRLKRSGSKKRAFYRVVVTDSRNARDSRSIEDIGYYNPLEDPVVINVDREKVAAWTAKGAQMTDTVKTLLRNENNLQSSRRSTVSFTAEVIEKKPKKSEKGEGKGKKARKAAAEGAVAVAEAPKAEAPKAEEAKAEAPAPEVAEAVEAKAEEVKAEAPAPEAAAETPEAKPEGDKA